MNRTEMLEKVKELKELKMMKEELENQISSIENEIKEEMTKQNVEELILDCYKIRYVDVTTNRFDTTTFKKQYEKLYEQFIKVTTSKRFTVA